MNHLKNIIDLILSPGRVIASVFGDDGPEPVGVPVPFPKPPPSLRTAANPHDWQVEEVNGGHVGVDFFYICKNCGASGGDVYSGTTGKMMPPPTMGPFLADGSGLDLPDDCEEAKKVIAKHKASPVLVTDSHGT